jgi:serine/threonine-protein kinase
MPLPLPDDSGSLVTEPKPHVIAGRYEVRGLVGVGGMGAVYKVYDRALDEVVALKMIRPEMSHSAEMLERLRREVKLARRVTHPNVARTFDFGEANGEHFLTMELVAGESLAMRLARSGPFDLGELVKLVGPICEGLAAAHGAGVVHRDLKPDNVLIGDDGRVVIMDFGVARLAAGSPNDTAVAVGTPAYMAPEQVEGSEVDARADIYQLGVMLFELLTGRLPFEASTPYAIAAMRLIQAPPDPRVHVPTLPDSVALLVRRCMARKPEDRPASALEVATRFAELTLPLGSLPPPSRPPVFVAPKTHAKVVGVLPFRNAGALDDAYLVDGITDDMIDALSMTPGLRVRARGAVQMHVQDGPRDPREVGRALAVQVVVCGTVRSEGDRVRVSARALSVDDGFQLWAQRFEGRRTDVLRIADDAAQAIAVALTVEKPTRAVVTNPQAVDLYLRGRHEFLKFWAASTDRAVRLLSEAHEIAPADPLIMSAYAAALARQFGVAEIEGRFELARRVARRAVEIAPEIAEAHIALASTLLHDGDAVAASREVTTVLYEIAPAHPDALELRGRITGEAGALRTSIEYARRCMQLEPRMQALRWNVIARSHALLGEWDEVALDCATPPADMELASVYWLMRARLTLWRRDAEEAARIAEIVRAQPPFGSQGLVLSALVFMASRTLASEEVEFLESRTSAPHATPRMRCFWHQLTAEVSMFFGDDARALEHIEQAAGLGLFDIAWLSACPLFEPLRANPRYASLHATIAARANQVLDASEIRGRARE